MAKPSEGMGYDIWQDFEKMRQDLTDNTHISRKALEAMLDAHKAMVAERDALAAHVERIHALANVANLLEADDVCNQLVAIDDESPATSLAKLRHQAEEKHDEAR